MKTITSESAGFSTKRLNRIRPVMQAYVGEQKLPGLITLVARRGEVAHFETYGQMDIEAQKPMRADALFAFTR